MIERHWNADLLAKIFGFIFILVGIAGFIPQSDRLGNGRLPGERGA